MEIFFSFSWVPDWSFRFSGNLGELHSWPMEAHVIRTQNSWQFFGNLHPKMTCTKAVWDSTDLGLTASQIQSSCSNIYFVSATKWIFCEYNSINHCHAKYTWFNLIIWVSCMSLHWLLTKIPFSCLHSDLGFPIALLLSLLPSRNLQEIQNWM